MNGYPRAGRTIAGQTYRAVPLAPLSGQRGPFWPTPLATRDHYWKHWAQPSQIRGTCSWALSAAVFDSLSVPPIRRWPNTPRGRADGMIASATGRIILNPCWSEWLMGFPFEWSRVC